MGFFSSNKDSGNKETRKDIFSRHGGKITKKLFDQHINRLALRPAQREYVKQVMEKHNARHSKGITREEFLKAFDKGR